MHGLNLDLAPRSGWTRVLAGALSLILTSSTAFAAAPAGDAQAEAEGLYRRGQAKYETADYAGAIELWTEAYALTGSIPDNAAIQALLIYNLAQAHIKAFELDEDAIHLKQAQQLLQSFEANLETVYGEDQAQIDAERAKLNEALADIQARMDALEPDAPEPGPEPTPTPTPGPEPTPTPGPNDGAPVKSGKPLLIAGGVLAGVGVGVGVVGIVGAVWAADANDLSILDPDDLSARDDQFVLGRTANTMIAVGSIGAGVLVTTGVALIVVGALRNKKAKAAGQTAATRPLLAPSFGPAGAGVTLTGRF